MICALDDKNPSVREEIQNLADSIGGTYKQARLIYERNNGNSLDLAPNGAESKLYSSLLQHYGNETDAKIAKANTYLAPFLKRFGDWCGEEPNADQSKLDENGEPLIDYILDNPTIDEQYRNHTESVQRVLQSKIEAFKRDGYDFSNQTTVEKALSDIRASLLSGMKSLVKAVDNVTGEVSDEFKANLKYQITNLQDNAISDIENIVYFIKTLASDIAPIAQEVLNASRGKDVLSNERLYTIDRNYFGFYNPLVEEIQHIYTQLAPFTNLMDKEQYQHIGKVLDTAADILRFSRYNLRRMQAENFKQLLLQRNINVNSKYAEEILDYIKDVNNVNGDVWAITTFMFSPDKVNDIALKTLYKLVQDANHKRNVRVFEKAHQLNAVAKNVKSFHDFYESDENGKPTGYLVRAKKYGQMFHEYHTFLNNLRIKYGLTPNDTSLPEDPEIRKKFAKEKNEWLSHRVERKYTNEFYELFDSLSSEAQAAREAIEVKIRSIHDKYRDSTGFVDKSNISKEDQAKLDALGVEKRLLTSIYNPDGTEKAGIERKIAEELKDLGQKLMEGFAAPRDKKKFTKLVAEKKKTLSKEEFDKWYEANTKVQYTEEFLEELRKIDKKRFGEKYAELAEKRNQLLAPYRHPKTGEPIAKLIPNVTKNAINRLEIQMTAERKKNRGKKVDTSGLYKVVPTSEYQRGLREAQREAEEKATVNNTVDPFTFDMLMESLFYSRTSHRTSTGWVPNSYYTKIIPVNPDHMEIVPADNFNELSPDSKFYNKNYDYTSNDYYQPKSFATEDFVDENGKKIKKGQRLYDNKEAFDKVNKDTDKKKLYDFWLETIEESNSLYTNRLFLDKYKLPQLDGSTLRYIKGKGVLAGLSSKMGSYFMRRPDDVGIEENAATAPDGQKLSMIPQYFLEDLKDPSTISADFLGLLMEYYQAAVEYDERSKIRAEAETIKAIIGRRTHSTSFFGKKSQVEGIKTNMYKMVDMYIDKNIYGVTTQTIKLPLFGYDVDISKAVRTFGKMATGINLMFNFAVAATSGLTSAYNILMQTVVGRYYDVHDTLKAMRFFVTDMFWAGIRNVGNRHYKSKITALMDVFQVGSELDSLWKNSNHNGKIAACLRKMGWWGMTVVDYCVKGQILTAILYNFKYVDGEFLSKEAYLDKYGWSSANKDKWQKYKSAMDLIEFKNGKIKTIDKTHQLAWEKAMPLIGNTARFVAASADGQLMPEQKALITMNAFGGLMMMHRQYIPVVLSERWTMEYQYDPNIDRYREASVRTIFRYLGILWNDYKEVGLIRALTNTIKSINTDVTARSNIRQIAYELTMILYVLPGLTRYLLGLSDEDDESWWLKFMSYVAMRTQFESGSPYNIRDLFNTIKTPTAAFGPFDSFINLFNTSYDTIRQLINGEELDTVTRGAYKDKSQWFKAIMKTTPLKNPYEQILSIDDKIRYYENQILKEEFDR